MASRCSLSSRHITKSWRASLRCFHGCHATTSTAASTAAGAGSLAHSVSEKKCFDVAIIGGGIVGLATARELVNRYPSVRLVVLEKEANLATHQSHHNSGVIHAGIYYKPGSLKAKLCVDGLNMTYAYCEQKRIPHRRIGKLIVATEEHELAGLDKIMANGVANGVPGLRLMGPQEMREVEPHCQGLRAIHSPNTGIVSWSRVARSFADDVTAKGGSIYTKAEVVALASTTPQGGGERVAVDVVAGEPSVRHTVVGDERPQRPGPVVISCRDGRQLEARHVITCGGLHADRLAAMTGAARFPLILPVRGEYLELVREKHHLVRGLIYPVPAPGVPFLGVHFTPTVDGRVLVGPNAVLALAREGYSWGRVNLRDLAEIFSSMATYKLAARFWKFGIDQTIRSLWIPAEIREVQKFLPDVTARDLRRGLAGVRAQALSMDGGLVEDFVVDAQGDNMLHVRNAPSPAATSSMAIAKMIADKAAASFHL
eukprot:jgi/Mesvir1/16952/Mv15803-RA.1